ncbi:MAG TPA: hypothetical protein VH678_23030 [Xanthobacteraceae bacterium]|jgi:hypothetical protein
MTNSDPLSIQTEFNLLSLRDLLSAREYFHLHLTHKPNVVATAVGRYRIRKSDPWPDQSNPAGTDNEGRRQHAPRTLASSEIRPYSWPAILVFVDRWVDQGDFKNPEDAVPPAVYMPNGQKVPICVIQAEKEDCRPEGEAHYSYPASVMGGGYPLICDVQGKEHVASVACLVTDGHKTFALTNHHVAGEPGTVISAIIGGNKVPVGITGTNQLTRKPFQELYPEWPGSNTYVDLDVGLVDLDDLNRWTTQVYGIGEIGPLADLDMTTISLRLIGQPVRAYGAASGEMHGEICALFYRFKSVGGFDYVADALIGPSGAKPLGTHPGDSGTLWLLKGDAQHPKPRPIALQWGGQVFLNGAKQNSSYALVTFLSTVCNQLDVTLLRDWKTGLPEYWGAVGHYSIATKACGAVRNEKLKRLMQANLENISYDVQDINKKTMQGLSNKDFVPLADVPDMVWKVGPHKRGGMNAPEHANHFADMDRRLNPKLPEGATLLEICSGKPQNVAVDVWRRYYDAVQKQFPGEHESRGLLPFRVWQIYDAMVAAVKQGDVQKFVCAAGILSHYVGDSCQPLHISYMFNGDPDHPVDGVIRDPKTGEKKRGRIPRGTGVHSAYEDDMVDAHVPEIMSGVDSILSRASKPSLVAGGHAAAVAVVDLMQKTFQAIAPKAIIDKFVKVQDQKPAARADAMWKVLGQDTLEVMADGCMCLAQLWDSAWAEGNGDARIQAVGSIEQAALEELYQSPDFLPSHTLDTIGPLLAGGPAHSATVVRINPSRGRAGASAGVRRRRA